MNEIQISYIRRFTEEDAMVDAVRTAIEKEIEKLIKNKILETQLSVPNEVLGQHYRAFAVSIDIIRESFKNLAQFKESKRGQDKIDLAQ